MPVDDFLRDGAPAPALTVAGCAGGGPTSPAPHGIYEARVTVGTSGTRNGKRRSDFSHKSFEYPSLSERQSSTSGTVTS